VRRGTLRFVLSQAATVRITVLRGGKRVRVLTAMARAGANRVRLPGLRAGTYRVAVVAIDGSGNASRVKTRRVTIR
jgi:predicted phage tail protein